MTIYHDFPDCLPRYAWLIAAAGRDIACMFHGRDGRVCKVCGETVALRGQSTHRRGHVAQLERAANDRKRAALATLKQTNRLRAEQRKVAA